MALGLNGSSRWDGAWGGGISDYPITLFVRAFSTSTTTEGYALQLCLSPSFTDRNQTLGFRGDIGGDPINYRRGYNPNTSGVNSSSGYSANTWHAIGASSASFSANDAAIYLDGVKNSPASGPTSFAPSLGPRVVIGAFLDQNTYSGLLSGGVFQAAFWAAVLTDAEHVSLARGFPPRRVRPQSLRGYWPLIRTVQDLRGLTTLSLGAGIQANVASPRSYGW
jgi:hypothetical protein